MNSKVFLLILGASWGALFSNSKAFAAAEGPACFAPDSSEGDEATATDRDVATAAVTLACTKPNEPFFGFDPRDETAMADFQGEMTTLKQKGGASALLRNWIHEPNTTAQLVGYLDSFGNTLAVADAQRISATLSPGQSITPLNLLNRAYTDTARLISGQVIPINESRKATPNEARVLFQAAMNLGVKKRREFQKLHLDEPFGNRMVDAFWADYGLENFGTLSRITQVHKTILLVASLTRGLGVEIGYNVGAGVDALLMRRGIGSDILAQTNAYLAANPTLRSLEVSICLDTSVSGGLPPYCRPAAGEGSSFRGGASEVSATINPEAELLTVSPPLDTTPVMDLSLPVISIAIPGEGIEDGSTSEASDEFETAAASSGDGGDRSGAFGLADAFPDVFARPPAVPVCIIPPASHPIRAAVDSESTASERSERGRSHRRHVHAFRTRRAVAGGEVRATTARPNETGRVVKRVTVIHPKSRRGRALMAALNSARRGGSSSSSGGCGCGGSHFPL